MPEYNMHTYIHTFKLLLSWVKIRSSSLVCIRVCKNFSYYILGGIGILFRKLFSSSVRKNGSEPKVHLFLDRSCAILSSFKIVVIFNNTSADFVLIIADVILKMTTILKEMSIVQLCSKSERTLAGTSDGNFSCIQSPCQIGLLIELHFVKKCNVVECIRTFV